MKALSLGLVLLSLSGCFLKQTRPNPPVQPAKGAYQGIVAVEDLETPQGGAAALVAVFAPKAASVRSATRVGEPQPTQCAVRRKAKAVSRGLVSVGKLFFGTALQSSHLEVPEDANHQYLKELNPAFPAGVYEVSAAGTSDTPGFRDYLQMPERLDRPELNGRMFSQGVIPRKGDPLELSWTTAALPNDDHIMVFDLELTTDTEVVTLHCMNLEGNLPVEDGRVVWSLPTDKMSALPGNVQGKAYLLRVIEKLSRPGAFELILQGIRTQLTAAFLEEA